MKGWKYVRTLKYNREHLPATELPPLNPDWALVDDFIMTTYFNNIKDEGDCFSYFGSRASIKKISKSGFDADTLMLIELLSEDFKWFYGHPTGHNLGDESKVLEEFLHSKYPRLSERSILRLLCTYCIDNR